MTEACETCEPVVVRNNGRPPHDADVARTTNALIRRVESGRMRYLGGDVLLEDMVALAKSDLKFTHRELPRVRGVPPDMVLGTLHPRGADLQACCAGRAGAPSVERRSASRAMGGRTAK